MSIELKVPNVGESITEVEIGEWLKSEGDEVERDETLCMIETDKVTVELPAPKSGVLTEIRVSKGETASVGDVIGLMEEAGAADAKKGGSKKKEGKATKKSRGEGEKEGEDKDEDRDRDDGEEAKAKKRSGAQAEREDKEEDKGKEKKRGRAEKEEREGKDEGEKEREDEEEERGGKEREDEEEDRGGKDEEEQEQEDEERDERDVVPPQGFARVMPAARRALKERGLDVNQVKGTGPGGRILKEDVERYAAERGTSQAAETSAPDRQEEVVAMSPMRRRIAERLVQAQQSAALLTTFNEIDMSEVMATRKQYQERFQQKYNIKIGFMSFFVKAAIDALKLVPGVNGEIRGTDIVYRNYYDIGVAIGGGKGLVVPVLRDADRLSFADVELRIAELAKRAQNSKLTLDELTGGTFTISNGGVYGSLLSTPIVNPPQSGILGLHAIQERPVAINGQVVIRPMMYIALTYDHRLVDGREAVTFLKRIKECVEQPARMLLEV